MEIAELFAQMRLASLLLLPLVLACTPQRDAPSSALSGSGSSSRIFGGTVVVTSPKAVEKYQPYAALLRTTVGVNPQSGLPKYHFCTVAPLASDMMLVNAHCLQGPLEAMRVLFRAPQLTARALSEDAENGELSRKVIGRTWHHLYAAPENRKYNPYDIAVLQLDRFAPEGTKFFGISSHPVNPTTFPQLKVLGYGYSSATFSGYDANKKPVYKTQGDQYLTVVKQTVLPNFKSGVFPMDGKHGKGTCMGDSGGPVFKKINDAFVLVGLTSERMAETDDYDQCNVDSISIDISSVRTWIFQAVNGLGQED